MPRLGVLTGGGDCPGLNAVIRAVVKTANAGGYEVIGFLDAYSGLVERRYITLDRRAISGLLHRGGTVLGTNNRDNPFHYPVGDGTYADRSDDVLRTLDDLGIECLVAIGGDGTLSITKELVDKGARAVGVPKTIDNDLAATDRTFGFDTAVATATEALDRLHTTAESHHRVMVLELMGRYAGWIALESGVAGGADVILIPEIEWTVEAVAAKILERRRAGKPFSVVVVAEGARAPGGGMVVRERVEGSADPVRLGGIGDLVGRLIAEATGIETRVTVLGHLQRGGSPSPADRVLATRFGVEAARLAMEGMSGVMVCLEGSRVSHVSLADATKRLKRVPPDHQLIRAARAIGISFGDVES